MALQGTIKDFGLADIFQLIGIQRKTGVLTLESDTEIVMIKFLEGQVVGADTRSQSVEDLLGSVLVRTGRITEEQLHKTLRLQKKTLQRLGHLLVKSEMISEDDLVEALRVQSLQIVYRLFRWRSGKYSFMQAEDLEYDDKHFMPIAAETILMEGARMVDEWPIIERRIKSDHMVFRKTEAAYELDPVVESIVDADLDFDFGFDGAGETQDTPKKESGKIILSSEEREVLGLIDGKRSVEAINDRCVLGEFDTYRSLAELLTRNLIEEVPRIVPTETTTRGRQVAEGLLQVVLHAGLVAIVFLALATLRFNPLAPWKVVDHDPSGRQLRLYASQSRLERIDEAIQVFYLDTASFPDGLEGLAALGYLREADLIDPWGRAYGFKLSPGGYQLFGRDAEGFASSTLVVGHRFNSIQQMMFDRSTAGRLLQEAGAEMISQSKSES